MFFRMKIVTGLQGLVLMVFAIILLLTMETNACRKRPAREIIEREHCLPKRVMVFVCMGDCHAAESVIDLNVNLQCAATETRQRMVRLSCSQPHDRSVFRTKIATISLPKSCSCQTSDGSGNEIDENSMGSSRSSHLTRHRHRFSLAKTLLGRNFRQLRNNT